MSYRYFYVVSIARLGRGFQEFLTIFISPYMYWIGSGTDPISLSLLISTLLFLFLFGLPSSKSLKLRRFKSDRDEIWEDCVFLQVNANPFDWEIRISDLTSHFQDGGHYVSTRRKVLPSGECIGSGRPRRTLLNMQPASDSVYSFWSIIRSYLLKFSCQMLILGPLSQPCKKLQICALVQILG